VRHEQLPCEHSRAFQIAQIRMPTIQAAEQPKRAERVKSPAVEFRKNVESFIHQPCF
jgi:hypothetical protein